MIEGASKDITRAGAVKALSSLTGPEAKGLEQQQSLDGNQLVRIATALEVIAQQGNRNSEEERARSVSEKLVSSVSKAAQKILLLRRPLREAQRELANVASNSSLSALHEVDDEGILGGISELVKPLGSRLKMVEKLCEAAQNLVESLAKRPKSGTLRITGQTELEYNRNLVAGFVKVVSEALDTIAFEVQTFHDIEKHIRQVAFYQKRLFGELDKLEELIFGRPTTINVNLPVYRENPLFTAALVDLALQIPRTEVLKAAHLENKAEEVSQPFIDTLSILADEKIFQAILEDSLPTTLARVYAKIIGFPKAIQRALKESHVNEALAVAYNDGSRNFTQFFDFAERLRRGETEVDQSERSTKEGDGFLRRLKRLKLCNKDFEPTTAVPTRERCLGLYDDLCALVNKVKDMNASDSTNVEVLVIRNLTELAEARDESFQWRKGVARRKKLKRDDEAGKHCFELVDGVGGGLGVRQIATSRVTFKDLIGSSWKDVEKRVKHLVRTQKWAPLYTDLSPRGKANNNMLIVGPYGMGKNHAIRALGNGTGVIIVHATADRLLSKWLGEAEQNVRRMYEIGSEIHERYERPVAIAMDEMDALFPDRSDGGDGAHHSIFAMQKTLQSVLDGDIHYDGVSLIGLTNEPQRIPVPIYRRFGTGVCIIQALTSAERQSLFKSYLAHLPLAENWERDFRWEAFEKESENASGDQLSIISDKLFEICIDRLERLGDVGVDFQERVQIQVEEKGRLDLKTKQELWASLGKDVVIPLEFIQRTTFDLLAKPEMKLARDQQARFYHGLDDLMQKAFGNTL